MTTINAVGNGLSGTTGSGTFVGATSPTLATPNIGVATATSINFGGGALSTYIPLTAFTPTFTFATAGNLSVVYTNQLGQYLQIGGAVFFSLFLAWTPTFTTSSGNAQIGGFPLTSNAANVTTYPVIISGVGITFPTGTTYITTQFTQSATIMTLQASGSGKSNTPLIASNFVSGDGFSVTYSGVYFV